MVTAVIIEDGKPDSVVHSEPFHPHKPSLAATKTCELYRPQCPYVSDTRRRGDVRWDEGTPNVRVPKDLTGLHLSLIDDIRIVWVDSQGRF